MEPTADPAWVLTADGYDPLRERSLRVPLRDQQRFPGHKRRARDDTGRAVGRPAAHLCGRIIRQPRRRGDQARARPRRRLVEGSHLGAKRTFGAPPLRSVVASHDAGRKARRLAYRIQRIESARSQPERPHIALRFAERARGRTATDPLQIEEGEAEIELEASFEGLNLGLASERLDQDLGAWRTRHTGKAPRYRLRILAPGRRPRPCGVRARRIEMVLEVAVPSRTGRVFRALRRHGAERQRSVRPGPPRARKAWPCAPDRLARRYGGARGGVGEPLAAQRRGGRRRLRRLSRRCGSPSTI